MHIVPGNFCLPFSLPPNLLDYKQTDGLLFYWQVFLMIWTLLFVLYNFPFSFLFKWKVRILNTSRFNRMYPYGDCVRSISLDDVFALSAVAPLLPGKDYAKLLSSLTIRRSNATRRNDSGLNDTLYFEGENGHSPKGRKGSTTFDRTMFHSCEQEPIGLESLGGSPKLRSKLAQRYFS